MSFTMFFTPAMLALLVLALVFLVQGIRLGDRGRLCASLGLFVLTGACISLVMEFITRM